MINGIVVDGQQRAYDAAFDRVYAEVEQEFAERLAGAGFWRRVLLRWQMSREFRRRMEKHAPPWGLYSHTDEGPRDA